MIKFWLVKIAQGETVNGPKVSKEEAFEAKRQHIAKIKAEGYEFESSTGNWAKYDDDGWDQWQEVYIEDEIGNHWGTGDQE